MPRARSLRIVGVVSVFTLIISLTVSIELSFATTPPQIDISLYESTTAGSIDFSLGFMLDKEWTDFRANPIYGNLTKDANFKLIRIINFKEDNPQPCTYWYESNRTGKFDWHETDELVGKVFDSGAQPLITLRSVPSYNTPPTVPPGMKIDPSTGLPYLDSFGAYCKAWVNHFKNIGKPIKYWEVINEAWYFFFKSWGVADQTKLSNFVKLFNAATAKMHEADPAALVSNDASTFRCFLDYFTQYGQGLGFLSFHKYDSGSVSDSDSSILNSAETKCFETTMTMYSPNDARNKYYTAKGIKLPVILTETNLSYIFKDGCDPRIQNMIGAIWTSLLIRTCILKGVQYHTYYCLASNKTSQQYTPTGGYGFGMVNRDNLEPWYPYYVHEMIGPSLGKGDRILKTTSSSSDVRALAWVHQKTMNLLLICKVNASRNILLHGLPAILSFQKIDNKISYEKPSLQRGLVDTSMVYAFRGYTVLLLQNSSQPQISDIAISNIYHTRVNGTSKPLVCRRTDFPLYITIANQGTVTETVSVSAYANSTLIGRKTVTMRVGETRQLTFSWDTSAFVEYRRYFFKAIVSSSEGEVDTGDNSLSSKTITLTHMGDINGDGKVSILDLAIASQGFASLRLNDQLSINYGEYRHTVPCATCPHSPNADINADEKIDVVDLSRVSSAFGWAQS